MGRVGGYGAGRSEQGVGQLLQLGFVGDGQQQGKLFTPDTGRQRTGRAVLLQQLAKLLQHPIPDIVAVVVIDHLEVIQIQQDEGVANPLFQKQLLMKVAPVWQPGQIVEQRLLSELGIDVEEVVHGAQDADAAEQDAAGAQQILGIDGEPEWLRHQFIHDVGGGPHDPQHQTAGEHAVGVGGQVGALHHPEQEQHGEPVDHLEAKADGVKALVGEVGQQQQMKGHDGQHHYPQQRDVGAMLPVEMTVVGEADVETIELHGVPRIGTAISLQTRGCVMACRGRITGNGWSVSVNERARSARYR